MKQDLRFLAWLSALPALLLLLAWLVEHVLGWLPCTLCVEIRFFLLLVLLLSPLVLVRRVLVRRVTLLLVQLLYCGAVLANIRLLLLEYGVLEAQTCSPFPFYSVLFPHPWDVPEFLQGQAICGEDIHRIFSLDFSVYTLLALLGCQLVTLYLSRRSA